MGAQAVLANGIDVTDAVLVFGTAEQSLRDVEVVLTHRVSTLTVVDDGAKGGAADDFRVIVFAAEAARRYAGSRYVALGVPGRDGIVSLRGLPPGEYYVAAIGRNALPERPALEGDVLESLVASAARVTLTEGGRRSVSVNVIGR